MCGFVICVDLQKGSSEYNVKIHLENCQHHRNKKENPTTMKWSKIFKTKDQAKSEAKFLSTQHGSRYRDSKNCVVSKN